MQSIFDPVAFLSQETTEAAVKRPPLNIGDYQAVVKEVKPRQWSKADGSASGVALDLPLTIQVPADQQEALGGVTEVTLTHSVFLDTTDQGLLDWAPGRNRGLRIMREATGQNVAGQPWSPSKLVGQPVTVKISHRVIEKGDSAGEITEQISGVTKL